MKRISILLSSLSVVSVVGACAPTTQIATRAETAPLSFQQGPSLNAVEDQAVTLNLMADELVFRSTVEGGANAGIFACGIATLWNGAQSCAVGAAAGAATGGFFGRATDRRATDDPAEMVSAAALVQSIRGMNGQMDMLEVSLPDLLAQQDAELTDLELRRDVGSMSQAEYEQSVFAISQSRARIAHALTLTEEQAKQANYNMQIAGSQGQDGLGWHLSATAQLAREASSVRSLIAPLEIPFPITESLPQVPPTARIDVVQSVEAPERPDVWSAPIGTDMVDLPRPGVLR